MKKTFTKMAIVAIALTMSMAVNAQETGDKAAGAFLRVGLYDGEIAPNIGIGAKFQYNVTDPIRLDGSFTFFFPKKWDFLGASISATMWNLDFNGHYLFPVSDQFNVYPLAGLAFVGIGAKSKGTIMGEKINSSASKTYVGVNLGGGVDFKLSDDLYLNGELKLQVMDGGSDLFISAGIVKKF